MIQQDDKDKRTPSEKESGVAEHDKANYTQDDDDSKNREQGDDDSAIKQTDDEKKKDDTGGDLAGNASGNSDND